MALQGEKICVVGLESQKKVKMQDSGVIGGPIRSVLQCGVERDQKWTTLSEYELTSIGWMASVGKDLVVTSTRLLENPFDKKFENIKSFPSRYFRSVHLVPKLPKILVQAGVGDQEIPYIQFVSARDSGSIEGLTFAGDWVRCDRNGDFFYPCKVQALARSGFKGFSYDDNHRCKLLWTSKELFSKCDESDLKRIAVSAGNFVAASAIGEEFVVFENLESPRRLRVTQLSLKH